MRNFEIKNQNGRSMIEMLGVLAIIGVLSVGGIAGYSKAMQKYRINKTIEQITLIAGNVQTFFAPQGNYDGLSSYSDTGKSIIKKAKIVPDEMLEFKDDSIKKINNVFGGDAALIAWRDKISFVIDLTDIPQDACVELLTQNWTPSHAYALAITTNVYSLGRLSGALTDIGYKSCNNTDLGRYGGGMLICSPIMDMEQATTYCNKENIKISFLFY